MNMLKKYLYQLKLLYNTTLNPIESILFYVGFKDELNCKLKYNGGTFHITKNNKELLGRNIYYFNELIQNNLFEKIYSYKIFIQSLNEEIVNVDGIKFHNNEHIPILWEFFMDNPFLKGDFQNRVIMDVGANIGDTSLFYAKCGANVFAFEPVPETCEIAQKNIDLNDDLKNNIKLFNYAIDKQDGYIDIYLESNEKSASANSFIKEGKKINIKSYSINSIIQKHGIKPDILKMDCEGAEYAIIENCDLSCFNRLMIEYHESFVGKSYEKLIKRLEQMGFKVTVKNNASYDLHDIGFILAEK